MEIFPHSNREFLAAFYFVISSVMVWLTDSRNSYVVIDRLPITAFVFHLIALLWREPEYTRHVVTLVISVSIFAASRTINAVIRWNGPDTRVVLWGTGVVGQIYTMFYHYSHGADNLADNHEIWAAGLKEFDKAEVRIGIETFKCVLLPFSLLDIGRLPKDFRQAVLVKAAQIALLWIVYGAWDIAEPSSDVDSSIMTIVRAALQKSPQVKLFVVCRTISILCNWTAFRPPSEHS